MTRTTLVRSLLLVAGGAVLGGVVMLWAARPQAPPATPADSRKTSADLAALQADVARLKDVTPSQSHAMADVAYHFANLWFAAQARNWPLAAFYLDETRSHVRWTIRIRPVRKDPAGNPVDLKGIFDGIDNGVLTPLKQAIDAKDVAQFSVWYRRSLEACYGCHKASGKPYLRPMIPRLPPQAIVNFDPRASWPQ